MNKEQRGRRQELWCLTASKKWPSARMCPRTLCDSWSRRARCRGEKGELELAAAVRRVRLLWSWTAAGLSVETILTLVNRGALSLAFLDAPVMALPDRLDRSYEQLAAERGVPMSFLQALHQSLGFAPPEPSDRAGEDDVTMLEVVGLFRGAGVADEATLRLLAVYADSLHRIAKAEADYYEANVERRLRAEGLDERSAD